MGLALGITLGAIGFVRASVTPASVLGGADRWMLALTISQAVAAICLWGTLVGATLPLIFSRLGFDPGYASSPFVATFVDVTESSSISRSRPFGSTYEPLPTSRPVPHVDPTVTPISLRVLVCRIVPAVLLAAAAAGCGEDESARPSIRPSLSPTAIGAGSGAKMGPALNGGRSPAMAKVVKTGPFEKAFDVSASRSPPAGTRSRTQRPVRRPQFRIPTAQWSGQIDLFLKPRWRRCEYQSLDWPIPAPPGQRARRRKRQRRGRTAKWVDLQGDFVGGAMAAGAGSGPIERMLGAAIPLGPRDFYLKLTGSAAAVADVRDAFREFVRSARISSGGSSGKSRNRTPPIKTTTIAHSMIG